MHSVWMELKNTRKHMLQKMIFMEAGIDLTAEKARGPNMPIVSIAAMPRLCRGRNRIQAAAMTPTYCKQAFASDRQ